MENRTVWIIVAVVVIGSLLCCCAVVVGAAVAGLLAAAPVAQEVGIGRVEERTEQVFMVGASPSLEIDSFAGDITVRGGTDEEIRAVVTKRAGNSGQMERITVDVTELQDGLRIEASAPGGVGGYRAADFEVFVPPTAQLSLTTGAGNVNVTDVTGRIRGHTGAGNLQVTGARAEIELDTGAGEVDYTGEPEGACLFRTGAGGVTLRLPADLDAEVDLHTGIGSINLGGFDVDGQISSTDVDGVIGTGENVTLEAHTGAGSISLVAR